MATTTINYGFDVPTSSDLVKNGATQIALLGQDIDTFLFRPFVVNPVINSAYQIWQRGTSFAIPSTLATYSADRWVSYRVATGMTVSRQLTNDTTNLPGIQYCARIARDAANTSTEALTAYNIFETVNSIPYQGKTVTLSFYARKGANLSSTTNYVVLKTGTGTDQNPFSGFTGDNNAILSSPSLTTTWARYSYTVTLNSNITQIAVGLSLTNPTGTAGAADYVEVTGWQLEVGSVATPFKTYAPTIQGELAACQRYYFRTTPTGGTQYGIGLIDSTTIAILSYFFPTQMRVAPTALETSGTASDYTIRTIGGGVTAATVVPAFANCTLTNAGITFTSTSLTAGQPTIGRAANTSAYLGWSAEL